MKNFQFIILIVFIITILGLFFYWFDYRPTKIRKYCFNTSLDFSKDIQNDFYINCVRGNGIQP